MRIHKIKCKTIIAVTLLKNVDKSIKLFDKVGFKNILQNSKLIYIIEEFSIFDIDITVAVVQLLHCYNALRKITHFENKFWDHFEFFFQSAFISAI